MQQILNKTFFKFVLSFMGVLAISFALAVVVTQFEDGTPGAAAEATDVGR